MALDTFRKRSSTKEFKEYLTTQGSVEFAISWEPKQKPPSPTSKPMASLRGCPSGAGASTSAVSAVSQSYRESPRAAGAGASGARASTAVKRGGGGGGEGGDPSPKKEGGGGKREAARAQEELRAAREEVIKYREQLKRVRDELRHEQAEHVATKASLEKLLTAMGRTGGGKGFTSLEEAEGMLRRRVAELRGEGELDDAAVLQCLYDQGLRSAAEIAAAAERRAAAAAAVTFAPRDPAGTTASSKAAPAAAPAVPDTPFVAALREKLLSKKLKVVDLMKGYDEDAKGALTRKEFAKAMRAMGVDGTADELDGAFDAFDTDGDGAVSLAELTKQLRPGQKIEIDPMLQPGAAGAIATKSAPKKPGLVRSKTESQIASADLEAGHRRRQFVEKIDITSSVAIQDQILAILTKNKVAAVTDGCH